MKTTKNGYSYKIGFYKHLISSKIFVAISIYNKKFLQNLYLCSDGEWRSGTWSTNSISMDGLMVFDTGVEAKNYLDGLDNIELSGRFGSIFIEFSENNKYLLGPWNRIYGRK